MKRRKQNTGFSLIELIIAIAILAILTGLLAPQFMKYIERAKRAKIMQTLDTIYESLEVSFIEISETGKQPGESIFIVPGYKTDADTFENALYSFLEEKLSAEEMTKIEIKVITDIDGSNITGLNNVLIKYYKPEKDGGKGVPYCYYYRRGEEDADDYPGTYGETVDNGQGYAKSIQWK